MYEYENPYAAYDPGSGLTVEELLARLNVLQARISSTISDVKREDDAIKEKQSQIIQDIDSIEASVLEIITTAEGTTERLAQLVLEVDGIELSVSALADTNDEQSAKIAQILLDVDSIELSVSAVKSTTDGNSIKIAQIEIDVDSITSTVSSVDSRLGTAESMITQQAGEISSKVSTTDFTGDKIWSMIDQTASAVKIQAKNINLSGITNVADTLTLGTTFSDQTVKRFLFRGESGGVGMVSSRTDFLSIYAGSLTIEGTQLLKLVGAVDFSDATVSGLTVSNANYANYAGSATYASYVGSQDLTISILSNGSLRIITSSGKQATYLPDGWIG